MLFGREGDAFCAKKRLERVVERLYDVKPLDTLALEEDLDELCHLRGVKLVPRDLLIARTEPIKLYKRII